MVDGVTPKADGCENLDIGNGNLALDPHHDHDFTQYTIIQICCAEGGKSFRVGPAPH